MPLKLLLIETALSIALVCPCPVRGEDKNGESFDHRIAPILAQRCLGCHAAAAQKGGLDLSSAVGTRTGGDSGPAAVPGKPEDSLLWMRVAADEMPPKHPLSAEEKALLRQWIADGAHWGSDPIDLFRYSTEQRAGYDWWSLQPVHTSEPPAVRNAAWPRNEVDRFVLARLEAMRLAPAAPADPRVLIRRLYFDLTGLPPSPEEIDEWSKRLASPAGEAAYGQLVDQLLDSPHYGERWARHWLDVIRFGESQGYERNRIRENAWRYRDWVIGAFNRDLPYDEFVRQQVAGDVLHPDDLDAVLATGYLVCGTWDQVGHNEGTAEMQKAVRQDDLEDLVAALGQSFLGLSINCARCHDHKFDPVSQREYYQVAALLGGVTQKEKEREGITARPAGDTHRTWATARDARRRELAALEQTLRDKYGKSDGGLPIEGLQVLYLPGDTGGKLLPDLCGVGQPLDLAAGGKPRFASPGPASKLVAAAKATHALTIEAWLTPARASQEGPARIVTLSLDTGQRNFTLGQDKNRFDLRLRTTKSDLNGLPSLVSTGEPVSVRKTHVVYTFDRAGDVRCYLDGKQVAVRHVGGDFSNWNDSFRLALGDELSGDRHWDGQLHFVAIYSQALPPEQVARNFASESRDVRAGEPFDVVLARASADEQSQHAGLRSTLHALEQSEPAQPFGGVAHIIVPQQPPVYHVLARGDYRNPGEVVSPRGLRALSRGGLTDDLGLNPDAPESSRRSALAGWLTDPRNPLTARVLVNRLWHYHFGQGLVDTPSDFGFAGGRPSHPELLDWLAARFVSGGWKIKPMHRLIVTSAAYRQASNVRNARGQEFDADNRLLWRANQSRLDGEATRDTMLAVSGALQRRMGGPSYRDVTVKLGTNHEFTDPTGEFHDEVNRRTIYRLWARCGNNPLLESLDCPDPSVMLPRRSQTITPVQSLSLLNSRFVEQCAARLAERARRETGAEAAEQIDRVYRLALGRRPQPQELELARSFLQDRGLEQLCLVLFNTNEFLFLE